MKRFSPKYPWNTFSLAHAANILQFPDGMPNFLFWLRRQKYLAPDLTPHKTCLDEGWFVNVPQKLPGRTGNQVDVISIPRLTKKGIAYFDGVLNDLSKLDFKSQNDSSM